MSDEPTPDAETAGETPPKPQRIFSEEAKQRQVTHWDWDYLPREAIDAALKDPSDREPSE